MQLPPEQEAIRARCFHPTGTFVEFPETEQSIPERFEQIVGLYPERLAVKAGHEAFTYDELNRVANRVAHTILAQRGTSEEPVAVFFEHGVSIIAAILGILKAGRIYVPLDPALPSARLAEMLEDSQAKLLLTNTQHFSRAQGVAQRGQQIVNCDDIDATVADGNLNQLLSAETNAIILYTSGSTGKPKGVLHNQRNIVVETRNYTNDIRICPDDRLSLCQSCSFANSIRNIYGALLNGAALFPYDLAAEGIPSLVEWLITNRITIFHTLETIVRRICESIPADVRFPELRILRFGGEASSGEDVKSFQRRFAPQSVLMNVIGLTETFSIRRYFVPGDLNFGDAKVPLGYGVADKDILILDETGEEVGANQLGEIAVRSKHVALGYWGRPDLTRTAFIPDPLGGEERTYLTGDLGVMYSDGCLFHMGRKDFQVKIRGNRVEITQVEAAILKLDSVRAVVVHAQADRVGGQRLVAYVVPAQARIPTLTEIRGALAPAVPEFMIPSALVLMESLPVVPNGRIDRRALPAWEPAQDTAPQEYAAPRSTIEKQLASIWAEVLETKRVGINDDFFELGGHSLTGLKLIARMREEFHIGAPLRWLFEFPTIAELATKIQNPQSSRAKRTRSIAVRQTDSLFALKAGNGRKPVFFLPGGYGGDGEFLVYARLLHHVGEEFSFFGLRPPSADGKNPAPERVEDMAAGYLREITAANAHGPYLLVGNCIGGIVAYEMACQLSEQGRKIADLILMDTFCPDPGQINVVAETRRKVDKIAHHYYLQRAVAHAKHLQQISCGEGLKYVWTLTLGLPGVRRGRRIRQSYIKALGRYRPKAYTGPISMIVSEEYFQRHPTLGWSPFVAGERVHVHRVPGDHESYIREHVRDTALQLQHCLSDASVATN